MCLVRSVALATAALFSLVSHATQAKAQSSVKFEGDSYELPASASEGIANTVAEAKTHSDKSVSIEEQTKGLNPGSDLFLRGRIRARKIFRLLVESGLEPARISFVTTANPKTGEVKVDVVSQSVGEKTATINGGGKPPVHSQLAANFNVGSSEPKFADRTAYLEFMNGLGQNGMDVIDLTGHVEAKGRASYNRAMTELRLLRTFEMMVRDGFPAKRIRISAPGANASEALKVLLSWKADPTQKETPLAPAVAASTPSSLPTGATTEPTKAEAPIPAPQVAEAIPTTSESNATSSIDATAFVGVLRPMGDLKDYVKQGYLFGVGVSKAIYSDPKREFRGTFLISNPAKMAAKQEGISGDLKVQPILARADYSYGSWMVRPRVGLGLGYYRWQLSLDNGSTSNDKKSSSFGYSAALGAEWRAMENLFIEPDLTYHWVRGDFNQPLLSAWIGLRYRLAY